jgi:pimeloyl-ACP methyl ester carboxylesterase
MKAFSIKAPNGTVSGVEIGDGPPLVLIAGLGSTVRLWGNLPAVLGRQFRVIAIDNRGVGGSRSGGPFGFAAAAEDLAAVLEERGLDRASLLGASMGGVIALHTVIAHPERVERLVVASSAPRLTPYGRRMLELLQDLLLYAPPERAGAALMTLAFSPSFHERFTGFVSEAADLYGPDEADVPGTLRQIEHLLRGWDLREWMPRIAAPTMVLYGDHDPVVSPDETKELASLVPNSELVKVPGAAHSVLAEGGEPVLGLVTAFLLSEPIGSGLV